MRFLAALALCVFAAGCVDDALARRPKNHRYTRTSSGAAPAAPSYSNSWALQLDGVDERMDCSATFACTSAATWTWWARQSDASWGANEVMVYKWGSSPTRAWMWRRGGSTIQLFNELTPFTGSDLSNAGAYDPTVQVWVQYVVVYDGSQPTESDRMTLYTAENTDTSFTDRALSTTNNWPGATLGTNTTTMQLGGRSDVAQYFTGQFDELAVWCSSLTSVQVAELRSGSSTVDYDAVSFGSPSYWYRFGDTDGDSSTTVQNAGSEASSDCTGVNLEAGDIQNTTVP